MKKTMLTLLAVMAMTLTAQAKTVKTSFNVSGLCELCEQRIERAAKSVPGVLSASWNQKTQKLALVYDNKKTTPAKVQKAIAAAGHDAGSVKASKAAYSKLPNCCRYRGGATQMHGQHCSNM
jgi:mercuric ion binding protein